MILFKKSLKILLIIAIVLLFAIYFAVNSAGASGGLNESVKQVKTANNPTVYYLGHNRLMKKAYISETSFLSYGNSWSDVQIVSQEELNQWQDVRLIKTASNPAVYYITSNKKALINNEEEFNNSGFRWEDIVIVNDIDLASYELIDFAVAGGNSNSAVSDNVLVRSNVTNPSEQYLSLNTKDNLVASFNFRAGNEMVRINSLTIKFEGVFNTETISKVYLKDNNGVEYGYDAYVNDRLASFNLSNGSIIIPANNEKSIGAYVDFGSSEDNVSGHNFQVVIKEASYIQSNSNVSGSFPIKAGLIKLIDGSNVLGQIKAEQQSLSPDNQTAVVGNTNQQFTKYKISETSDNEDVLINKLVFKDYGTVNDSEIINFQLKNHANQIIAQASQMANKEISFEFDDYLISKSDHEYFEVYGNVISGEGKTIKVQLYEIKASGDENGFGLPSDITSLNEEISVTRENLGVIALDIESNSKVFSQQAGSIIGLFEIRNNNQDITIENIQVSLTKNSSAPALAETVYLIDYNTGNVISYVNGSEFNNGSVVFGLGELVLDARDEVELAFVTELPVTADDGDTYKITLNKITYRASNGEYYYDEVNAVGNTLTVSQSDIYIYANNEEYETDFTKGEEKVKIGSFILEAAAGADAEITSLVLAKSGTSGSITYNNGFSNLKVYIGSKRVGTIIKQPYGDSFTFDGFSYKLKAEKRVEVKVYADIDSDLKVSQTQLKLTNLIANEYTSGTSANIHGLNTASYIADFGELNIELKLLSGGGVSAGEDNNLIATFQVINTGDEITKLRYLTLETYSDAFSYSLGYSDLEIISNETGKRAGRKSKPVAGANRISMSSYKLDIGESAIFSVYVDASQDVPSSTFQVYFKKLEAKGKNSKIEYILSSGQSQGVEVAGGDTSTSSTSTITTTTTTTTISQTINEEIDLIWPVDGDITYGFHDSDYPYIEYFEHTGIDIEADQDTELRVAADGVVINAYDGGTSGYSYITIKHNDSLKTSYGHVSAIYVNVGEQVSEGQAIGLTGGTPGTSGAGSYSNGPHLHFEVLLNNVTVDPEDYLD